MSDVCETVTIKTENGAVTLNKCDFDKKIHTLFDAPEKTKQKKTSKSK